MLWRRVLLKYCAENICSLMLSLFYNPSLITEIPLLKFSFSQYHSQCLRLSKYWEIFLQRTLLIWMLPEAMFPILWNMKRQMFVKTTWLFSYLKHPPAVLYYFIQVRDTAINTLVEIYRHVGEKVRIDLGKKGIPSSRYVNISCLVHFSVVVPNLTSLSSHSMFTLSIS